MKIAFRHGSTAFQATLSRALAARLETDEFFDWLAHDPPPADDIEILLAVGKLGRAELESQRRLSFVQTTSAGYEEIDVAAATALGIWVSYAPAGETGNAISVAEWAVMLMIGASRRLKPMLASVGDPSRAFSGVNAALCGKTACIVGLGAIGRLVAERLLSFGMTLVGTDSHPADAPTDVRAYPASELKTAVAQADYVVLCAPASKDNERLVDADVLAATKRGAILVNVSRGTLVDETALANALRDGRLAAVGLDVVDREPVAAGEPLLDFPQALVKPHVAGATDLMLAGTVDYVASVVTSVRGGTKPASTLNEPTDPRVSLRSAPTPLEM